MALFERLRRGNRRVRGAARAAAPRTTLNELAERLTAIREAASAPEDALEPALQAVVEASGAGAGAICLYDVRQCILRLTAEVGLSDDGCKQLRTVRRADPACWDIPLHGLLNRRAYLIESASKNRYVPRLVEPKTPITTVVCIPMFAGMTPLGSLILVSTAPRIFTQRDIETLWGPLRGLAGIIEEIRRRVTVAAPSGDLPVLERANIERSAIAAERDQLLSELAGRREEGERLAAALEEQIAVVASLRAELEETRAQLGAETPAVVDATPPDGADDGWRARVAALENERDELRLALARAEAEKGELDTRRERAESALAAADEATREGNDRGAEWALEAERVRGELEAEATRLASRVEELEQELAGAAANAADTATLAARIEELEARLAAEGGELGKARQALQEREATTARLDGEVRRLDARCSELSSRLGALDDELTVARSEREQARQAERAKADEIDRLQTAIETLTSERDVAAARGAEIEEVRETAARHAARVAELESALDEERAATRRALEETAQLRDVLDAATAEDSSRDGGSAALEAEIARLRETCDRLQREHGDLSTAHEAALERLAGAPSSGRVTIGVSSMFESELQGEVDESVTVISVPPEPLTPIIEPGSMPLLVVIDSSEAWKSFDLDGYDIYVAPPDTDAAAAVAALDPVRIVANLAAGVVNTLGALRKAGSTARFWGCIADPEGGRAISLGMIEPVIPPIDPDGIIAKLGPYANRGSKLVTVGTDVDALMSLRQALARRNVSVSMAWDAKQGLDLIHQARPDALVIDLELPKKDGYLLVTRGVAQLEPPPYTLLVGGRSGSGKAFLEALASLDASQHVRRPDEVLAALASCDETRPARAGGRHERVGYGGRGRGEKPRR